MRIAISSGHSWRDPGAVGVLNERAENVRVADRLGALINAASGSSAVVFHDNASQSSRENVNSTAAWHNQQTRDLDVQVHFNAFQPTPLPRGTEALYVTDGNRALAARVSQAIAGAGGFIDRGAKKRTDLGFLNLTKRPALLIETCFVDSHADAELYRAKFEPICRAMAESLIGGTIGEPLPAEPPILRRGSRGEAVRELQRLLDGALIADGEFGQLTEAAVQLFQTERGLHPDGVVGPLTWAALLEGRAWGDHGT